MNRGGNLRSSLQESLDVIPRRISRNSETSMVIIKLARAPSRAFPEREFLKVFNRLNADGARTKQDRTQINFDQILVLKIKYSSTDKLNNPKDKYYYLRKLTKYEDIEYSLWKANSPHEKELTYLQIILKNCCQPNEEQEVNVLQEKTKNQLLKKGKQTLTLFTFTYTMLWHLPT